MTQQLVPVAKRSELADRSPKLVTIAGVEVLLVRLDDDVYALQGRCPHRGASLEGAQLDGQTLTCKEHGWDFSVVSGTSQHVLGETLARFRVEVVDDDVCLDEDELRAWRSESASLFDAEWELDL